MKIDSAFIACFCHICKDMTGFGRHHSFIGERIALTNEMERIKDKISAADFDPQQGVTSEIINTPVCDRCGFEQVEGFLSGEKTFLIPEVERIEGLLA